jgi:phenylpropionate dioxygenase-like ring-hydroxylating dioxygenase large terminal subunit
VRGGRSENAPAGLCDGWLRHRGWYVVALSAELERGGVRGAELFGERLAVFRDSAGAPAVLGARCAHMGADLARGSVVGDELQCAFHHFRYGRDGRCSGIPSGGRVPSAARVAAHPARERGGMIWVHLGEAPASEPPGFPCPGGDPGALALRARRTDLFPVEPWVILGNSFDFQHLRFVHGLRFEDPAEIRWGDDGGVEYEVRFDSPETGSFEQRIRVGGTNTVAYVTSGAIESMGLFTSTPTRAGSQSYYVAATPRRGRPEEIEARLAFQESLADALLADDTRAFAGMDFQIGALVPADRELARWFRHAAAWPVEPAR